jgi:hypothetical protein
LLPGKIPGSNFVESGFWLLALDFWQKAKGKKPRPKQELTADYADQRGLKRPLVLGSWLKARQRQASGQR